MTDRPTIFISAVSGEFRSFRQAGEFSQLGNALLHAMALLAHDDSGDTGWPLAKWLLHDGQDLFFAVGRLASARDSLTAGEAWMQRMPPARSAEPSWRRESSVLLNRKGDVQLAQGDLTVSHAKLGEVAARAGDKPAAQREFSAGLAIMERLCRLDPTNATWHKDAQWLREQLEP